MDAGLASLGGVLLGSAATLAATWMTLRSARAQARDARRHDREDKVRTLAAEAYPAAIDAIQWLSTMHVEDSVDPQFAGEYLPKTEHAVARARRARELLSQVAALGGAPAFGQVALDTVVALESLDHAWHQAQDARRGLVSAKSERMDAFYDSQFEKEHERLSSARTRLCGFADHVLTRDEIDAGSVRAGSLLHQLREMTSRPELA